MLRLISISGRKWSNCGLICSAAVWLSTNTLMLAIFCRTSIGCGLLSRIASLRKMVQSLRLNIRACMVCSLSGSALFTASWSLLAALSRVCASMSRGDAVVVATRA
nr:hypothetical protein BDOA9_0156900 [Bradyrhizobium sp. DOA9]